MENVFQNKDIILTNVEKCRETKIKRGLINVDNNFDNYWNYKKEVTKITSKNKKTLKNIWSGFDYYDGEYIKENYEKYDKFNENYPNIDHKISIRHGFDNGYSIEEISSIENLCITKRKLNMKKYNKTEEEFKKILLKN